MSADAIKAFAALRPHLKNWTDQLPRNRGVSASTVAEVGRHLAYQYDPHRRGYVDDTAEQIAEQIGETSRKVKRALQALDLFGLWTVERRGWSRHGEGSGSRRTPGPTLCATAHRLGLDLSTPQTRLDLAGTTIGPSFGLAGTTSGPSSDLAGTTGGLAGTTGGLAGTTSGPLPTGTYTEKDDDDTRKMVTRGEPGESSSSDGSTDLEARAAIRLAARALTRKKNMGTGYRIRTEEGLTRERLDEARKLIADGYSVTDAAMRLSDVFYVRYVLDHPHEASG